MHIKDSALNRKNIYKYLQFVSMVKQSQQLKNNYKFADYYK